MSPKHKLITTVWCSITMIATVILSHGHLILREVMANWPEQATWEGRLETALYTQGGLVFLASFVIGGALLVRGYFIRVQDDQRVRKELVQRERHERAAASRHDALMDSLAGLSGQSESVNGSGNASSKKAHASGG